MFLYDFVGCHWIVGVECEEMSNINVGNSMF